MPSPTYTLIASTTLSSPAPTFDFTSIPNTYYDLRLHFSTRADVAGQVSRDSTFTMNGATTNSYVAGMMYNSTNTQSYGVFDGISGDNFGAANSVWGGGISPAGTATSGSYSNGLILIPGYVNTLTRNKARFAGTIWGAINTAGGMIFYGVVGTRSNVTSVVNRVTLTCAGGSNYLAGSTVSLYGCNNTVT